MPGPVVVKVGSSSITDAAGRLSDEALRPLIAQLAALAEAGTPPVLVTSGAIASGRGSMHRAPRSDIAELQALAAVGQGLLMARYARLFGSHSRGVGQVLFTAHDFGDRTAYLNARHTLTRLLDWGVVPIVNENDTTATEEISLGENDRLAALVAAMLRADLLVILTDTPGIFSSDPRLSTEASLIEEVAGVDAELEAVAGSSQSGIGTGGMATKVAAAKIASWSGVPCVIAGAAEPDVLRRLCAGEAVGTRVHARARALPARKVWIAFALRAGGRVVIDDGAARALREHGGSLLPVGMRSVEGDFAARTAVEVMTAGGDLVAKGLSPVSAVVLRTMCGKHGRELPTGAPIEALHRDDLVVLAR
jgi:glutamate 5-kinase